RGRSPARGRRRRRSWIPGTGRCRTSQLHPEVLDDRVGEELPAHVLDALARRALADLDLDVFADADALDLVEAEAAERLGHRLPLRVEDAFLQRHVHARFHIPSAFLMRVKGSVVSGTNVRPVTSSQVAM